MSKEDVVKAFTSIELLEKNSHKIVLKDGYMELLQHKENHIDELTNLHDAYHSGCTIVIRNMENFKNDIVVFAKTLSSKAVDVHMYVSPAFGSSFPKHKDDRDVYIACIYGTKTYDVGGVQLTITPGDVLFIPKDMEHFAVPGPDESCVLSFGVPVCFTSDGPHYPLPFSL